MLLVDTSGSMRNIIWHSDFSPSSTSYPALVSRTTSYTLRDFGCTSGCWLSDGNKSIYFTDPYGAGFTRYYGNYINYLFDQFDDGTRLDQAPFDNSTRIDVARNVATDVVLSTPGMRFGLAKLNLDEGDNLYDGGTILASCGSPQTTLVQQISQLDANTNTPLAEALYEITRYFRGMGAFYTDDDFTSPIQYRCQNNFTVVISDGFPTYDTNFPNNDPDDPNNDLPDWDGLSPATSSSQYPNFPQYSDGFLTGSQASEGYSLYLDDIAKFGWDIDMMTGGADDAGVSFDDPEFEQQNMGTYTVGFSTSNQMLEDAAEYGSGQYFTASNAAELSAALQSAISDIAARSSSSSSAASNTGFISSGARVYQARYNGTNWTGQLLAFDIDTDISSDDYGQLDTSGSATDGAVWDAAELIPSFGSRTILTYNTSSTTGVPFTWDAISPDQQTDLNNDENLLNYLRGQRSLEEDNGGTLRDRDSLLGDIINSSPFYVGAPAFSYPDNWNGAETEPEDSSPYSTFRADNADRDPMIYVGANDGMLHGFDAESGVEQVAYVPGSVYGNLDLLADPNYSHRYYVDGSPTAGDVFFDGAWHSVLVSGLNKGGRGIFALDVTSPSFSESNADDTVLWEFTSADDSDLGFTYSRPAIVRLNNGEWAAIFGNGYNSDSETAALFIVSIEDGSLIKKIDTGVAGSNGLATPAPVDVNGDYIVDRVYAGDLQGNLWRFDLSGSNTNQWGIPYTQGQTKEPLFTACLDNACSDRQPITVRPEVGRSTASPDGVMIYFGTGKYLEPSDGTVSDSPQMQSFYGVLDSNLAANQFSTLGRDDLLEQEILFEQTETFDGTSFQVRVTSDYLLETDDEGWFLDLAPPGSASVGEMQVTDPLLRAGKVFFTTLIPGEDPCRPGGTSWLMELDAQDGSRLSYTPFDLNSDGSFGDGDLVEVTIDGDTFNVPVSGYRLKVGAAASPSVMAGQGAEFKYVSGEGGIEAVRENPGPQSVGRMSWEQLR